MKSNSLPSSSSRKGRSTNQRNRILTDSEESDEKTAQSIKSTNRKADLRAFGKSTRVKEAEIYKGMDITDAKMKIFILEDTTGFDAMKDRSKMSLCVQAACQKIQMWYYKMGSNDTLPRDWNSFKEQLFLFIESKDLSSIRKFREESFSEFIERLVIVAEKSGASEENILEVLRGSFPPKNLIQLLYIPDISIEEILKNVVKYEKTSKKYIAQRKLAVLKEFKNKDKVKKITEKKGLVCHNCGEEGHIRPKCPTLKQEKKTQANLLIDPVYDFHNEDKMVVKLNGMKIEALRDTGSSVNVLSAKICKVIPNLQYLELDPPMILKVLDGHSIAAHHKTLINLDIKGKVELTEFLIVENAIIDVILGTQILNKIKKDDRKTFPVNCDILTPGDEKVNWTRPIKSHVDLKEFKTIIKELEIGGVIEPSDSKWLNPVVLTRKKNGALRFCLDLRKLNNLVVLENFEIPNIQHMVRSLRNRKIFSIIDLKDGYFHVEINPEDRHKTAFLDPNRRIMHFKKMPQGFKNSPTIFQKGIYNILEGLVNKICLVYIDDILIFGEDVVEHDQNLKTVMNRLNEYRLEVNIEKSEFRKKKIKFLGYYISENKLEPTLERSQGIKNFPSPTTKKRLMRFLGFLNYDRNFIPMLSDKLKIFYCLIGDEGKKFTWDEELEAKFQEIKELWSNKLELTIPDMDGEFSVECDASGIGLGIVLKQNSLPVAYNSRLLKGSEKNYTITEREILAILFALDKFEYYLRGKKFRIVTDHRAIEAIKTKPEFGNSRIKRWMEKLDTFDFEIEYKKGVEMIEADILSREVAENTNNFTEKETADKVMEIHVKNAHRKEIGNILKNENIKISENKINEILKNCQVCARKNYKHTKSAKFRESTEPGELIAVDIMEIDKNYKIILAIDYFSRYLFGRVIAKKSANIAHKFIKDIYDKFKFKALLADN